MRWIRFLITLMAARYRAPLRINDTSRLPFTVWITDIDASIMNHAALMTVMELGRIDFMVRTGFFKLARREGWYFPSSSIQVQFFRPLKLFQKAELHTRVFHIDESRIYIEQSVLKDHKPVACCVVKSTVKKGRDQLNILEILKQLNIGEAPSEGLEMILQLEQTNALMKDRIIQ